MRLFTVLIIRAISTVYSSRYPNAYTRSCDPSSTSAISSPLRSANALPTQMGPSDSVVHIRLPSYPRFAITVAVLSPVVSLYELVSTNTSALSSQLRSRTEKALVQFAPACGSYSAFSFCIVYENLKIHQFLYIYIRLFCYKCRTVTIFQSVINNL